MLNCGWAVIRNMNTHLNFIGCLVLAELTVEQLPNSSKQLFRSILLITAYGIFVDVLYQLESCFCLCTSVSREESECSNMLGAFV